MVYLEFVDELGNGDVIYDYMPERRDADRGAVSVNRMTRECRKLKGSSDGDWWSEYHRHAWRRIIEMIDSDDLEEETFAAWY